MTPAKNNAVARAKEIGVSVNNQRLADMAPATSPEDQPLAQSTRSKAGRKKTSYDAKSDVSQRRQEASDETGDDQDEDFATDVKNQTRKTSRKVLQQRAERESDKKQRPWAYEPSGRQRKELDYDEYWKKIMELSTKVKNLTTVKKDLETKSRQLKDAHGTAVDEMKTMEEHFEVRRGKYQKKLTERDSSIQKLTEERLASFKKRDAPVTLDDEVQADFACRLRKIKAWASDWSTPENDECFAEFSQTRWQKPLTGSSVDLSSERAVQAVREERIPTRVLLNGLVNHIIFYYTFEHPFAFLRTDTQGGYDAEAYDKFGWLLGLAQDGKHDHLSLPYVD